jgi:sulfur carrier protein
MTVTINGVVQEVEVEMTVATIVADRAPGQRHVAVARNGTVVPRSSWPDTRLQPGDTIEVLAAVAGG